MTKPDREEAFSRLNRLQRLLHKEDDRSVVLLTSAYLEDLLGRLLAAFMLDVKAARDLLEGFNAPLGTFASRIQAAHAMGLVTDVQHADLELLRKARNAMAHSWEKVSLEDAAIADRVRLMSDTRLPDEPGAIAKDLSERLRQCVSCTMIELEVMISQVGRGWRGGRLGPIGLHLYPGPVERA